MSTVLWECDDCGGSAKWTFLFGLPYYLCDSEECRGVAQVEMFPEIDRVVSVSASERPEEARVKSMDAIGPREVHEDLPF